MAAARGDDPCARLRDGRLPARAARGPRAGAAVYDAAQSYLAPAALGAAGHVAAWGWALPVALIRGAHVGIDRALGFGSKGAGGFGRTHLSTV